eukprot:jgi/Pico_ML_1/54281/g4653.t1
MGLFLFHRVLRGCSLVFGFLGLHFLLLGGFLLLGFIAENNYQDFGKLRWSRCSRTDKGVHAACNVVSLKLVVEPDAFEKDPEGIEIAERVNQHLPNDLNVSSVKRVSKSFRAREWCKSRTYEYYVPGKVLGIEDGNPQQERLEKLQEALESYVGNRPFHNFTVMKNYVKKPSTKGEEDSGPVETMVFGEEERKVAAGEGRTKRAWGSLKWQLEVNPKDKVGSSHYRKITDFVVKEPLKMEAGNYLVPLQVTGLSFMYNQIRIMEPDCFLHSVVPHAHGDLVFVEFHRRPEMSPVLSQVDQERVGDLSDRRCIPILIQAMGPVQVFDPFPFSVDEA